MITTWALNGSRAPSGHESPPVLCLKLTQMTTGSLPQLDWNVDLASGTKPTAETCQLHITCSQLYPLLHSFAGYSMFVRVKWTQGVFIRFICCIWCILQSVECATAVARGWKTSFSFKHFWTCFWMVPAESEAAHQVMLYLLSCTLQHLSSIKLCC